MSEQTLKFGDIVVNKKEFHASKQAIALNSVKAAKILVSYKFKHSDDGFKYFIDYLHDDDVIRPLCIILPQMSGYIKYFDNGGKMMIYDEKYIKTKAKTFSNMINTLFPGNEIPKEKNHYICIAAVCIDSTLRIDKKNYPQVYFEQCKYKIKKKERQ